MSVGKIIIFYLHKASGNYHISLMFLKREVTAKKELDRLQSSLTIGCRFPLRQHNPHMLETRINWPSVGIETVYSPVCLKLFL